MTVRIAELIDVNVDPGRDLHGPCVARAANGDLLLCHQDSEQHRGGDGFVHQWRSQDSGFTWSDEGASADWRDRGYDSLFGEYGLAEDGSLVMIVQRREVQTDDLGVVASWIQVSNDHGATWSEIGPVDDSDAYAVMFGRGLVSREGTMYAGVWSRHGNRLYVSENYGRDWVKRSIIFPTDYPDFSKLADAGPPFYPHVIWCPDESLLAMTYHTPPIQCCYSRRSRDAGRSWEPIVKEAGLDVWAPRMKRVDEQTLMLTGRDIGLHATVAYFSENSGITWGNKVIVDEPAFKGSYAYTDSIVTEDGRIWVFTSSPKSEGKGDIVGVLLERV